MEKVAFLVEESGEQIACLLNPEGLLMKRLAGVARRQTVAGSLTGSELADDPLLFTGGGTTELDLDLLFDIELTEQPLRDVRQLTRPLWRLAENSAAGEHRRRPPAVRFIWGKAWNVPGVVVEVAERFDRFTESGMPSRSWMRLRFVRIGDLADRPGGEVHEYLEWLESLPPDAPSATVPVAADTLAPGGAGGETLLSPRALGQLSHDLFGTPHGWKALLRMNGVDDPLRLLPGQLLRAPRPPGPPS